MLTRTKATLLALLLTSHGSLAVALSKPVQRSDELVGEWVGWDASVSLLADGTGSLEYQPLVTTRFKRESAEWVFPIKKWSLSGKNFKLKIGQPSGARYDDGSPYTLQVKARFEAPLLFLELWDANHFRRITMQRESEAEATIEREIPQAGTDGVTNPRLVIKTKVAPKLPSKLRGSGRVVLSVLIEANGTVSEISVIRCNRPGLGIEESAIGAVRHWRYEPAEKNGEPVAVYFTVVVSLTLHG